MMPRGKFLRVVAAYLLISFLIEVIRPSVAFALTGGPSQPEVQSFEPVGTTQMVDLFSGDFTYNIPLLTVPGPNGGYPINLAYHAGIGMEQEASWVGLGWNINPGAIIRNMRGLPDDFNGDDIIKTHTSKPNATASLSLSTLGPDVEALGFNFDLASNYQLYYNNYKGVGMSASIAPTGIVKSDDKLDEGWAGSLSFTYDSETGLGFSPSLSRTSSIKERDNIFRLSANFHSRQGFQGMSLKYDRNGYETKNRKGFIIRKGQNFQMGAGVSLASSSYVPANHYYVTGQNFSIGLDAENVSGLTSVGITEITGGFSRQFTPNDKKVRTMDGYGYLYSENRPNNDNTLMDFNREKDGPITKRTPNTYVPVHTYDIFMVQGQGTGGAFRPFRSDMGIHTNDAITNYSYGAGLTAEIGGGTGFKLGVNADVSFDVSYSGKWTGNNGIGNVFDYKDETTKEPLYEPFYFRSNGELAAQSTDTYGFIRGDEPVNFRINMAMDGVTWKPNVQNIINEGGSPYGVNLSSMDDYRTTREMRVQNIEYFTVEDVTTDDFWFGEFDSGHTGSETVWTLYDAGEYPIDGSPDPHNYYYPSIAKNDHLGRITVVNPNGNRYIYGIPAYNFKQKEVAFSVNNSIGEYNSSKLTTYTSTESSVNNASGDDNFYTCTELPPYAHSFLLTAVVSPDYVDLKGDGPTKDDFGYYSRFNYTRIHDAADPYQWRVPYDSANYSKGYYSNDGDDKGSYTYGTKEMYYLNSVETKTHVAIFKISDRTDGLDVTNEGGGTGSNKLKKLDAIELYSWDDPTTPITVVHFEYDYALCDDVDNGSTGKLTLKKVWFTHLGNDKGSLSPYEFSYDDTDNDRNPDYDQNQMDRWGNFQPDELNTSVTGWTADGKLNTESPYTIQDEDYDGSGTANSDDTDKRNDYASAWNLRKIILPSGGVINIEYEADDYSHVQNLDAMQMVKIIGTGKADDPSIGGDQGDQTPSSTTQYRITNNYRRIFVEFPEPVSTIDDVEEYIQGIDNLYFKTWQQLKELPESLSVKSYDYVEGYCKIDRSGDYSVGLYNSIGGGEYSGAWIEIEEAVYGSNIKVHPFRKAGFQYLRYSRPDLFGGLDAEAYIVPTLPLIVEMIGLLGEFSSLVLGYYNTAKIKGWCKYIDANVHDKPSYLRLNVPTGIKYGGGCRVSKVTIDDNWIEDQATYGQEYTYRMPDGTSSGVAEYEPLIGGEENPFRQPVWYNGSQGLISFKNNNVYLEEPFGESYFPGANVGYRRVVVKNIDPTSGNVNNTASGVTVHEFYTAKDFPVKVDYTEMLPKGYNVPIIIPFIGSIKFQMNGYSQGYSIRLNDMHGKPRKVAVYPHGTTNFNATQPVSSTEYVYHQTGNPDDYELDNTVTVLDDHGQYQEAYLGYHQDFIVDMQEHSNVSHNVGFQLNFYSPVFPSGIPTYNYSQSMFRSVVTNKIIYQTGILKEVVNMADGAIVKTENLMYDAATGTPLLTKVTNEWQEPVYTYNYAAHWSYPGMDGAWQNWNAHFLLEDDSDGGGTDYTASDGKYQIDLTGSYATDVEVAKWFLLGDELIDNTGAHYWVADITDDEITLEKEDGSSATALDAKILDVYRSGHRNQQSVQMGTIVSLKDPTVNNALSILTEFNDQVSGASNCVSKTCYISNFYVCDDETSYSLDVSFNSTTTLLFEKKTTGPPICSANLVFDNPVTYQIPEDYYIHLNTFNWSDNSVTVEYIPSGALYNATWNDDDECYPECIQILHADATSFEDDWDYNYTDVGNPDVKYLTTTDDIETAINTTGVNEYRFGRRGIWRPDTTYVYYIDRLQSGGLPDIETKVDIDGEYQTFTSFNWETGATSSDNWDWTSTITQYSPYGFELEVQDRLGIYATEMYGYKNSVVTATAANSRYMEMAYDGFEDYGITSPIYTNHGHMKLLNNASAPVISSTQSHTGKNSLRIGASEIIDFTSNSTNPDYFTCESGEQYTVSAWFYADGTETPAITVVSGDGGTTTVTSSVITNSLKIEGWTKVEIEFTATIGSGTPDVDIKFEFSGTGSGYVDDIRIHPFDGTESTYVYDPQTLWLIAELDNRNFATFYNYDEEGNLVQVKKETTNGIVTLSTTRQNIHQEP